MLTMIIQHASSEACGVTGESLAAHGSQFWKGCLTVGGICWSCININKSSALACPVLLHLRVTPILLVQWVLVKRPQFDQKS